MQIFWEIVASNALIVTVLAVGIFLLSRFWRNPVGLHLLWVLILLKLCTPPIVTLHLPVPMARSFNKEELVSNESSTCLSEDLARNFSEFLFWGLDEGALGACDD